MTIQQHAYFDSSAAELNATSKLVKAWESKNAKNAARAGGVSLMALSLAACGGSDDVAVDITSDNAAAILAATPAIVASASAAEFADIVASVNTAVGSALDATTATGDDVIAAIQGSVDITTDNAALIATAVAAVDITTDNAAAISTAISTASGGAYTDAATLYSDWNALANPTALSQALVATQDVVAGTIANDSFTATGATLTATDVITDGTSTDADTLTITLAEGINGTAPTTVSGIETVTYNVASVGAVTVDVANIVGANITVNNTANGASTAADVNNLAATSTLTLGTGITGTAEVLLAAGSTATVNAGSATVLNLENAGTTVGANIVAGASTTTIGVEGAAGAIAGVASDTVAITAVGAIALNTNAAGAGTDQVEFVTLSGNGAAVTYT
ncbi:hypothetical protein N9P43_03840 [Planktomarina temperata]|nr:hypothetical protein [Planktomarina temperata]